MRKIWKRVRQSEIFDATSVELKVAKLEHESPQPVDHLKSGEKQAMRPSKEDWDGALSLVNFSRVAWVLENPSCQTLADAMASSHLVQLQREDIKPAYRMSAEDVWAALILVDMSKLPCDHPE